MRTEPKPSTPPNNLAALPRALAPCEKLPLWAGWKFTFQNGRWTKPPYRADNPLYKASARNPRALVPPRCRSGTVQAGEFDGASILLTEDGELAGIDLDKCITSKSKVAPWAREIVKRAEAAWHLHRIFAERHRLTLLRHDRRQRCQGVLQ